MQEEKFRYRVGPDLGARIALLTINAIFIIIIWWVFYKEAEHTSEDLLILIGMSVTSTVGFLIVVNEKIDVYKGKVVYRKYIRKRTYLVKEFGEARHEAAPVYAGFYTKTDAYVFYNMNKKILFYLPTTYENADKLFKEMELHYEQKRKAQRCK